MPPLQTGTIDVPFLVELGRRSLRVGMSVLPGTPRVHFYVVFGGCHEKTFFTYIFTNRKNLAHRMWRQGCLRHALLRRQGGGAPLD